MTAYAVLARRAHFITIAALGIMLAIIVINTLVAPTGGRQTNWVVWGALSLPLFILLPGIVRRGVNSYAWLSFVSLLYFAQAVIAVAVPQPRLLDGLHLFASIALFLGALLSLRWRARANRAAA